jgi:hypothetical protein
MAATKLEVIEPKNVTHVLLGVSWQKIVPESFQEVEGGYTCAIPPDEPGGEHKLFIPSPGLQAVME